MIKIVMGACVLHNFALVHDDFDESYFLKDDSDSGADDGDASSRDKLWY